MWLENVYVHNQKSQLCLITYHLPLKHADFALVHMLIWYCFSQPGRDAKGAALALFTARLHRPDVTTHKAVLQAIIYQLDKAIEWWDTSLCTCTTFGLTFVFEMPCEMAPLRFDTQIYISQMSFPFLSWSLFYLSPQFANSERRTHIYLWHDQLFLWKFRLWALCQDP